MARKSEIREQARAGLEALLKVASATDEGTAAVHLQEALEHLAQAGHGVSLREVAAKRNKPKSSDPAGGDTQLREALAYATGQSDTNPLRNGENLLDRLGIDPDYLGT